MVFHPAFFSMREFRPIELRLARDLRRFHDKAKNPVRHSANPQTRPACTAAKHTNTFSALRYSL